MCLCRCYPPSLPAHLFPHSIGFLVWSSDRSSLKPVSLLPEWLSDGVFSPYALTLLCQRHCFWHWGLFMFVTCSFSLHDAQYKGAFALHLINVSPYRYCLFSFRRRFSVCCVYAQWLKQAFPPCLVWTIVRWWLQSSYILQSAEVVSSINQVEFVSITPCMLILVWVEITRVNGGHSSHFLDQDTGGNAGWPESLSSLKDKNLFLLSFLWV